MGPPQGHYTKIWQPDIFKGKVALITGGSGSICSQQAKALATLGCSLSIIGREPKAVDETVAMLQKVRDDIKVVGYTCDVRSFPEMRDVALKTVDAVGRIDFVVCGAAGNFLADFNHLSSKAFKAVIDIDLIGSFNTVKACYEQLREHKGSIIFISATLHYYGVPMQSHVGAAKAGIDALSNALAVELGPVGIRVNCIAPGPIGDTEGFSRIVTDKEAMAAKIPLQRVGSKFDIANATIYLFSEAAAFVTGTIQVVDGGFWQMGNFNVFEYYPEKLRSSLLEKAKL